MLIREIVRKKREGQALTPEEIRFFIRGLTTGAVAPEQASALAMAVFFRSMDSAETGALTQAMATSGKTIDWEEDGIAELIVDKHSTGGVGDKVSLVLAPLVAACGARVPMISGRGLGHSGGTLDKLDSIPGYNTSPDLALFKRTVKSAGCAIIGQTDELAPADRRLYAIRDVTATVESVPLITASILSKKIAAGLRGLAMDVKTGSGAFMETEAEAEALARSIVDTAAAVGLPVKAVITDMNEVLGRAAGHAVEVRESIDYLTGAGRDSRLHEVVFTLAAAMLALAGIEQDPAQARRRLQSALDSGQAAQVFSAMVRALGGPADLLERVDHYLPLPPVVKPVFLEEEGYVASIDARQVGLAILNLGAGRQRAEDNIDYGVGLTDVVAIGARVDSHRPVAQVRARDEEAAAATAQAVGRAYRLAAEKPAPRPVIRKILSDAA